MQYHQLLDGLAAQWNKEQLPRSPIAVTNVAIEKRVSGKFDAVTISAELVEMVGALLNAHEQGRARGKDNPLTFLEASIPESAGRPDLLSLARNQWKALHDDAQGHVHENGKGCTAEHELVCAQVFERFETLLSSLAGSYYDSLENIDALLEEANA